jgi:hypothetical protein
MRLPVLGSFCLAVLLLPLVGAQAGVPIAEPTLAQRVALADCVVVGKVTSLEPELVEAASLLKIPGARKVTYQIAVVAVRKVVRGPKELTQVRVGFIPPPPPGTVIRTRRFSQVKLTPNQEGCLFLRKHPDESFFVIQAPWDILDRATAKEYAKEVEQLQHCARLLDDPAAGLRSKDADARLLTATMLVFRYRTAKTVYTGTPRTEPIDADQSRLILAALTEADFSKRDTRLQAAPVRLFMRLGLTKAEGWEAPGNVDEIPAAAKKWLHAHGATYRIQRYVPEEPAR